LESDSFLLSTNFFPPPFLRAPSPCGRDGEFFSPPSRLSLHRAPTTASLPSLPSLPVPLQSRRDPSTPSPSFFPTSLECGTLAAPRMNLTRTRSNFLFSSFSFIPADRLPFSFFIAKKKNQPCGQFRTLFLSSSVSFFRGFSFFFFFFFSFLFFFSSFAGSILASSVPC